jgi:hypothetical protein
VETVSNRRLAPAGDPLSVDGLPDCVDRLYYALESDTHRFWVYIGVFAPPGQVVKTVVSASVLIISVLEESEDLLKGRHKPELPGFVEGQGPAGEWLGKDRGSKLEGKNFGAEFIGEKENLGKGIEVVKTGITSEAIGEGRTEDWKQLKGFGFAAVSLPVGGPEVEGMDRGAVLGKLVFRPEKRVVNPHGRAFSGQTRRVLFPHPSELLVFADKKVFVQKETAVRGVRLSLEELLEVVVRNPGLIFFDYLVFYDHDNLSGAF